MTRLNILFLGLEYKTLISQNGVYYAVSYIECFGLWVMLDLFGGVTHFNCAMILFGIGRDFNVFVVFSYYLLIYL